MLLRSLLLPDSAPGDPSDAIDGFRILSLVICFTSSVLVLAHALQLQHASAGQFDRTVSLAANAVLVFAGLGGFFASRLLRSAAGANLAAALLLGGAAAVVTADRLPRVAPGGGAAPSLIPMIFAMLMLGAALMPFRPSHVLGLAAVLLSICSSAALLLRVPLQWDVLDFTLTAVTIVMSVTVSARATAQRVRVRHAHDAALDAARQTEEARVRVVLAESAITMERLAASLSHELNTPLGALSSATETLATGLHRHASFHANSRMPELVGDLTRVIRESIARLRETVTRIQRFANLDRGAIRLIDLNQLVQDAVALMNPPSADQAQITLNLSPLAQIWCRPHALSVALASILNTVLERSPLATVETLALDTGVQVKLTAAGNARPEPSADLDFEVVSGRVRATGWDLFAARQLVRESGGDLRTGQTASGALTITISLPACDDLLSQRVRESNSANVA